MASVHIDTIGEIETALGFDDVPEHREHVAVFLVDLEFDLGFVPLQVFFVHSDSLSPRLKMLPTSNATRCTDRQ